MDRRILHRGMAPRGIAAATVIGAALALTACGSGKTTTTRVTENVNETTRAGASNQRRGPVSIRKDYVKGAKRNTAEVRVNRYAWQAALDSVSFMPLRTSDPYGGVIATDWYSPAKNPNERIRVNVRVGGPELRSNTVAVTVFRETRVNIRGAWRAAKVNPRTAQDLENVILSRARELRNSAN
jgi:hypothetical protein